MLPSTNLCQLCVNIYLGESSEGQKLSWIFFLFHLFTFLSTHRKTDIRIAKELSDSHDRTSFFWMWCFKEVHLFRPQMSKSKFLKRKKKRNCKWLVYLKSCVTEQLDGGEGFLIQERDKWEDGAVLNLALDRRQPYGLAVTSYLFRLCFAGLPWIRSWLISQTPSLLSQAFIFSFHFP